jgi:hypothetical protein
MSGNLPEHAVAFVDQFRRLEHVLRRSDCVRTDQPKAVIDWRRFARELGPNFFAMVIKSGAAEVLIREPPRIYCREGGMAPENPAPITDVEQLIVRGMCQVRNNILHGEKYVERGSKRDDDLVMQALWVLQRAIDWHPATKPQTAAAPSSP